MVPNFIAFDIQCSHVVTHIHTDFAHSNALLCGCVQHAPGVLCEDVCVCVCAFLWGCVKCGMCKRLCVRDELRTSVLYILVASY